MKTLQRQWRNIYLLLLGLTCLFALTLGRFAPAALPTLLVSLAVFSLSMIFVRWSLALNRPATPGTEDAPLYPTLGIANRITIVRAYLFSLLAGVVLWPNPGRLVWSMSAGLYLSGVLLDYLDGVVARREGRLSVLGQVLEGEFDSMGVMVAAAVLVVHEVLPPWYLLVGLIRYLFVAATWWRRRRGRVLHPLIHSPSGKIIAGYQMVFLAAALMDQVPAVMKEVAGTPIALFLFAGFGRDWLGMTGVLPSQGALYRRLRYWFDRLFWRVLPLGSRWVPGAIAAIGVAGGPVIPLPLSARLIWWIGSAAIALGWWARTAAVILLTVLAWQWNAFALWAPYLTIVLLHLSVAGAGWPTLFAPEPRWFARR